MAEWWWGRKASLQRFALFKDPTTPVDAANPLPFSGKIAGAGGCVQSVERAAAGASAVALPPRSCRMMAW